MVEAFKRLREPFGWFVLVCAALQVVVAAVRWVSWARTGRYGWGVAGQSLASSTVSLPVLVLVIAAVSACIFVAPRTHQARTMARVGGSIAAVAGLLSLAMLVVGLVQNQAGGLFFAILDVLGGVIDLAVKLGAALFLFKLAAAISDQATEVSVPSMPSVPVVADPALPAPSWSADQAVGAVWTRAGDAASGAAGRTGWQSAAPAVPAVASATEDLPTRVEPRATWPTAAQQAAGVVPPTDPTSAAAAPVDDRPKPNWGALPPRS